MRKTRRAVLLAALVAAATAHAQSPAPFDQGAALARLRKQIAGRENLPAEEVFKNVTILKGMPAGRLLAVMSMGFGRSLGVDCTHCHVPDRWEVDEKAPKAIARQMWAMTNAINAEHLARIPNLKGPNPIVNCTTCHRGQLKPALNLPAGP
jgi:hypothetical protein